MNPIIKSILLILSAFLFISCDNMAEIFTTNYYEILEQNIQDDVLDLDDSVDAVAWSSFSEEEKLELINDYTTAVLSDDSSSDIFEYFKENKTYKKSVTDYYLELLDVVPESENISDILIYQKRALALCKIEVFTAEQVSIDNLKTLFIDYSDGNKSERLTFDIFVSSTFELSTEDLPAAELTKNLVADINSLSRASYAINVLGNTIIDTDNPTSVVLDEDDGVYILLASIIGQILNQNSDNVFNDNVDELVRCIESKDISTTDLLFPKDMVGNNSLVNYLGDSGALVFTATGYILPSVSLLGGEF